MSVENPKQLLDDVKSVRREYLNRTLEAPFRSLSELETFKQTMKIKYQDFFNKFEALFNMCFSKNYDYTRIEYMVNMSHRVFKNEITEHNASVAVGQLLVNEIVKPQLDAAGVKPGKPEENSEI